MNIRNTILVEFSVINCGYFENFLFATRLENKNERMK